MSTNKLRIIITMAMKLELTNLLWDYPYMLILKSNENLIHYFIMSLMYNLIVGVGLVEWVDIKMPNWVGTQAIYIKVTTTSGLAFDVGLFFGVRLVFSQMCSVYIFFESIFVVTVSQEAFDALVSVYLRIRAWLHSWLNCKLSALVFCAFLVCFADFLGIRALLSLFFHILFRSSTFLFWWMFLAIFLSFLVANINFLGSAIGIHNVGSCRCLTFWWFDLLILLTHIHICDLDGLIQHSWWHIRYLHGSFWCVISLRWQILCLFALSTFLAVFPYLLVWSRFLILRRGWLLRRPLFMSRFLVLFLFLIFFHSLLRLDIWT